MESVSIMNMTFGSALNECIKNKVCICRKEDLEHIITAQVPANIEENIIPKMTSLNNNTKEILLATCKKIKYHNQLLKINLKTGEAVQYMPTAEDLFANDWCTVASYIYEDIIKLFRTE